jgi:hypothetical protein
MAGEWNTTPKKAATANYGRARLTTFYQTVDAAAGLPTAHHLSIEQV